MHANPTCMHTVNRTPFSSKQDVNMLESQGLMQQQHPQSIQFS